jgi:tRNA dimethylallyltransferase
LSAKEKTLIVIAGPTAVGKTALSIEWAKKLNTCILSADSRQFYKEMKIGTAAPSESELKEVKHHFIAHLSIHDYYNVSMYEIQALEILKQAFKTNDYVIVCGGSGLYIDAISYGIDTLPDPDPVLRKQLTELHLKEGTDDLLRQLKELDPEFYEIVDINNPKRILRALEVCIQTNQTYTSLRKNQQKKRDFSIVKYCLSLPRETLYQRINRRTDQMIADGLLDEAKALCPFRHLNALNTVGYKELFGFIDGKYTLEESIEKIKTNTRRYAKRQITWFKRDKTYQSISPQELRNKYLS